MLRRFTSGLLKTAKKRMGYHPLLKYQPKQSNLMRYFSMNIEDLDQFDGETKFKKNHILKARNEAKQLLQEQNKERELAQQENRMTVEQITRNIIDVEDLEKFQIRLMKSNKPTVMFVFANWCKVSQNVLPMILDEYSLSQEKWDIAVFDIDKDSELTSILEISRTPTMVLIHEGEVIDGVEGLPSSSEFRLFFNTLQKILSIEDKKKEREFLMKETYDQYELQNYSQALGLIEELEKYDHDEESDLMIKTVKIDCLIKTKSKQEARTIYYEIKEKVKEIGGSLLEFSEKLKAELNVKEEDEEFIELKAQYLVEKNPEIGLKLAEKAKTLEMFELSIELFLEVIESRDLDLKEEAMEGIRAIFEELGHSDKRVKEARRELSMLLY